MSGEVEYDALVAALKTLPPVTPAVRTDRRTRARAHALLAARRSLAPRRGTRMADAMITVAAVLYAGAAIATALHLLTLR